MITPPVLRAEMIDRLTQEEIDQWILYWLASSASLDMKAKVLYKKLYSSHASATLLDFYIKAIPGGEHEYILRKIQDYRRDELYKEITEEVRSIHGRYAKVIHLSKNTLKYYRELLENLEEEELLQKRAMKYQLVEKSYNEFAENIAVNVKTFENIHNAHKRVVRDYEETTAHWDLRRNGANGRDGYEEQIIDEQKKHLQEIARWRMDLYRELKKMHKEVNELGGQFKESRPTLAL